MNITSGAKVWLQEANRQHTIYRRIDTRSRLEVLYLLEEMKFSCAWCDEFMNMGFNTLSHTKKSD